MHIAHVTVGAQALRETSDALLELGHIGANLRIAPMLAGVADDRPDISLGRRSQDVTLAQEAWLVPNSSSTMALMLRAEVWPGQTLLDAFAQQRLQFAPSLIATASAGTGVRAHIA
jgi:hypothetical protein